MKHLVLSILVFVILIVGLIFAASQIRDKNFEEREADKYANWDGEHYPEAGEDVDY